MASLERKSFGVPDRQVTPPGSRGELVDFTGMTIGRYVYEPGWRWVDSVAPLVGSDWCAVEHYGYVLSGRLLVGHQDGSTAEVGQSDVYHISPGHRGEVAGDEPFVTIEFLPESEGAKRGSALG